MRWLPTSVRPVVLAGVRARGTGFQRQYNIGQNSACGVVAAAGEGDREEEAHLSPGAAPSETSWQTATPYRGSPNSSLGLCAALCAFYPWGRFVARNSATASKTQAPIISVHFSSKYSSILLPYFFVAPGDVV